MTRYIYIRQCRHSQPVGCVAYTVDHDNETISYGVSVIHPKAFPAEVTVRFNRDGHEQTKTAVKKVKDVFNRKTARAVAEERMKGNPTVVNVDDLIDNHWNNRIAKLQEQLKNNPGHVGCKIRSIPRLSSLCWMILWNTSFKRVTSSWKRTRCQQMLMIWRMVEF